MGLRELHEFTLIKSRSQLIQSVKFASKLFVIAVAGVFKQRIRKVLFLIVCHQFAFFFRKNVPFA